MLAEQNKGMLNGIKVLDMADEKGILCGRILANLGADVIKIEKPNGDTTRNIGPFYHDIPDPNNSLFWYAFNVDKRGITLNLESTDGKAIFGRLVKKADIVIESFPPGYLDKIRLGYSNLKEINSRIILTSITPFGQTGPYQDWKASDQEIMALGGMTFITGDPDRPPVTLSVPIGYHLASAYAAGATLIAYHYQEKSGQGQHIDVSAQQSVIWLLMNTRQLWEMEQTVVHRQGQVRDRRPGIYQTVIWECKDGAVSFCILGGSAGPRVNKALAAWIIEERSADEFFKNFNWDELDWSTVSQEVSSRIDHTIAHFFKQRTKAELYDGALKRRITLTPINTTGDIVNSIQLAQRQFWVNIKHPELKMPLSYPGSFFKSSLDMFQSSQRAPLIGEHNMEVYRELGFSDDELRILKQSGAI